MNKFRKVIAGLAMTAILTGFTVMSVSAQTDTTTLAASLSSGSISCSAAFTSGANSKILGYVHSCTGVINYGAGTTVGWVK